MATIIIKISPREQLMLCGFLSQNAKAKGAVEERALVDAFDEFGLTPFLKGLETTTLWSASEDRAEVGVSSSSLRLVLDVLNGDAPKAPVQALILRPLADDIGKMAA